MSKLAIIVAALAGAATCPLAAAQTAPAAPARSEEAHV